MKSIGAGKWLEQNRRIEMPFACFYLFIVCVVGVGAGGEEGSYLKMDLKQACTCPSQGAKDRR